jgi:hypothetical protein
MPGRFGWITLVLCVWLAAIASGCKDSSAPDVNALAKSWVDRQLDSLSDSTLSTAPDSANIDSLAKGWTSDEWLQFWEAVEREQLRRRVVDTTRHGG